MKTKEGESSDPLLMELKKALKLNSPMAKLGGLKKCWRAYKIATKDWHGMKLDEAEALKYALRIRKLQWELEIRISEFPDLGLYGTDPADVDLMTD